MSASLIISRCVQVTVYDQGDSYSHIRAGTVDQPGIICDDVSDLPAQAGGIDGVYLEMESSAHVISTNEIYTIDSSGSWIIQDDSPFSDVYTKSEVDALNSAIWTDIGLLRSDIMTDISKLINDGAKNRVRITAQSGTHNAVTFTINDDQSVTLSGTASQYYPFRICGVSGSNTYADAIPIPRGEYILSGIGSGASPSKQRYILGLFADDSKARQSISIYDDYVFTVTSDTARFDLSIYTATGAAYSPPITVYPMITETWKQSITNLYVPYSPTNAELAALIRSYHP